MQNITEKETNKLFPIFLKLEQMRLVIIGGGYVGLEKLTAVVTNSPATQTTLIGKEISSAIRHLAAPHPSVTLIEKEYEATDLADAEIVIAAVNDRLLSSQIYTDAKAMNKLINVADKPELCDFYLSSVVQKGNLKIAISTNGKSPTVAKRVKEMINDIIPEEIDSLLDNIQAVRQQLKGDFEEKVKQLNELTKILTAKK
jgi:siroheme synthase-like protein